MLRKMSFLSPAETIKFRAATDQYVAHRNDHLVRTLGADALATGYESVELLEQATAALSPSEFELYLEGGAGPDLDEPDESAPLQGDRFTHTVQRICSAFDAANLGSVKPYDNLDVGPGGIILASPVTIDTSGYIVYTVLSLVAEKASSESVVSKRQLGIRLRPFDRFRRTEVVTAQDQALLRGVLATIVAANARLERQASPPRSDP